jgi:hypothetical protein
MSTTRLRGLRSHGSEYAFYSQPTEVSSATTLFKGRLEPRLISLPLFHRPNSGANLTQT